MTHAGRIILLLTFATLALAAADPSPAPSPGTTSEPPAVAAADPAFEFDDDAQGWLVLAAAGASVWVLSLGLAWAAPPIAAQRCESIVLASSSAGMLALAAGLLATIVSSIT